MKVVAMIKNPPAFLFIALILLVPSLALAKGDLAIKAKDITLQLGNEKNDYHIEPKNITLETGQAYEIEIIAQGYKNYTFMAPQFFQNVWIRRIEAEGVEIATQNITSIEFEDENEPIELEIVVVPIRTGTYPFYVEGLESRGMVGQFIVQ